MAENESGMPRAAVAPAEAGPEARALTALRHHNIAYRVTRHGRVRSLAEAAALRGIAVGDILKTLVVRRGDDDFLFVLVPGDREFSWRKLRALLGTSRLSMPDAAGAHAATGYERGTITPFGARTAWPVYADSSIAGRTVSMGAGAHGVSVTVSADQVLAALGAELADLSATP